MGPLKSTEVVARATERPHLRFSISADEDGGSWFGGGLWTEMPSRSASLEMLTELLLLIAQGFLTVSCVKLKEVMA